MEYVIYKITTLNNNMPYYGRSQEFEKRKRSHTNLLRANKHPNKHLQDNFNEYGMDNFTFEVIEVHNSLDESIEAEQRYIKDDNIKKYNISDSSIGGGDNFSNNPKKEIIRQMRVEQMTGEGNHQYGKPKTEKMINSVKEANSKKICVDGVIYNSLTECSKINNIKITTLHYRLSKGFEGYQYV